MNSIVEALRELNNKTTLAEDTKLKKQRLVEEDEYLQSAKEFAQEILDNKISDKDVNDLYYIDYAFDKLPPQDEAEEIVYNALKSRMSQNDQIEVVAEECQDDECLQENIDEEGDLEDTEFSLADAEINESLNEGLAASDRDKIKQDPRFNRVHNKVINKLYRFYEEDTYGDTSVDDFLLWINDICGPNNITPVMLEYGEEFTAHDIRDVCKADKKFLNDIFNICVKIGWVDAEGHYLDAENKPLHETKTAEELLVELLRMSKTKDDKKFIFNIIRDVYFNNNYKELERASFKLPALKVKEPVLQEDVNSSLPARALSHDELVDYIDSIPTAQAAQYDEEGNKIASAKPPVFFKLGYLRELKDIAAKYRGGRGSTADDPMVRIFKATEYSKLYTGADYEALKSVKQYRKETGIARSGEKTGFSYGDDTIVNKIGRYADGSEALQAYIANDSRQKVKYFISLNDEDLHEATREEVAQYLTPAGARNILTPTQTPKTKSVETDAEGNQTITYNPQQVNRFKISNIYMIGNLGQSIM